MALRIGAPGEPTPELAPAEFARLYRLPPAEAVDYLARRGRLTETFDWRDLWQGEHLHQFTVSRLARLDLLEAMRDGIVKSVDGDLTRRDWTRDIRGLLERSGWWGEKQVVDPVTGETVTTVFDPPRLKLIYDTNTNQAYAAGLWERIERNKKTSPYIRYITQRDEKVRVTHQAWDNLALPVDHPFWATHFPPNGWRCRCRAMSMSQAQYDDWKARGRIKTEAPPEETRRWVDTRSGEIHQVPIGIDPGFGYNPGKASLAQKGQLLLNRALAADPRTAALAIREYLSGPGQAEALADDFQRFSAHWMAEIKAAEAARAAGGRYPIKATGELRHVGALSYGTWMALWRRNLAPDHVTLSVRDVDIVHAFRGAKSNTLPPEWYARLPEKLLNPDAVLLDTTHPDGPAILMLFDHPVGAAKLVVRIGYATKKQGLLNIVETGRMIDAAGVAGRLGNGYELIEGAL